MLFYCVTMIAENLKSVTQRIAKCCDKTGKPVSDVKLVCVTKSVDIERIRAALGLGVAILGENRVQEAVAKYRLLSAKAEWHLIGHLQTNKVKDAVGIFNLIHSVDSIRLAAEIDKEARKAGKVQDALIEVNVSEEPAKYGVRPADLPIIIKEIIVYNNISIKGLMAMAPETYDPEKARPYFCRLRQLRDEIVKSKICPLELGTLSMGMSGDFEVAIEEGSNMVRIGRAIFGS